MNQILLNLSNLHEAIHDCLARNQQLPSLILLYAGIDIVASLESKMKDSTRQSFTRWVDSYLLPNQSLSCTALELFAARCGIVHTLTAESRLSQAAEVRVVFYAWGNRKSEELNAALVHSGKKDVAVAVHVGQLADAFRAGAEKWTEAVLADPERLKNVEAKGDKWFVNINPLSVR